VSNYYVSPNGSDSNDGSASSPWLTLTHADSALTLGLAGTTVHVLPGIYSGLELVLSHSGTSTQRIVWQSDTPWSAQIIQSQANGTDCCVVVVNGSYVDMVGFDVSSTLVNTSSATTLGRIGLLANTGVSIHFLGNRIHDVANGTGGLNCSAFGGQGVGSNTGSTGTWVRGNWIFRVGAPGTCNKIHGIYDGSPNEIIDDNVIFQNAAWGINCVHACSDSVITNNTVFSNGGYGLTDVGTFSMGGCVLQGSDSTSQTNTIKNNICYNNGAGASGGSGASILNISGTVNDVLVVSNLIYNPQSGNGVGGGQGCTDDASCVDSGTGTGWSIGGNVYGTVPGFVNYQPDGSGDYDLAPGSAAAGAGATICLGSPVSCTPTNDVAGTEMSNPPPIGAYTAPILTSSITITPSSYDFGIVPVGGANTVLTTVTNAETTSTHWGACGDTACSGGASDATTFNQSFGSPSILSMTGPAYSNALFYYKIPGTSAATTFATDFYVTPDANGPTAQTFEFDTFQFLGGVEYMWGSQCNQARGVWQIWDQLNTQWVDISPTIPCAITAP
ncbi:MAG: right-handed parallel beta-helix repeat-containing protein, partial [Mycobacteriales bacterium]